MGVRAALERAARWRSARRASPRSRVRRWPWQSNQQAVAQTRRESARGALRRRAGSYRMNL
eukprot:3275438-Pleurochrysis_carterae.AAC.4